MTKMPGLYQLKHRMADLVLHAASSDDTVNER